ncbi:16S rRNA methyltransferase [Herbaspirillum rubrisubalbicans]|uniref:Ribosomal RNA small subunit methyltransferase G n=2 Tax=Herbaspirillum rubrisubalbicans TaxID=80842 RepID=A0ABX9BYB2_9BURK|nr:16S rRNA (guanine(527)-N(7))-methyltransferase RsmG [Herbaspirillum rubrisubalbicans]QJQ03814.1 16S rRNA (guanine(527)-N(7))-methyltransferase RsmG [Herbaspirillum rubrisubalbicans Os34]RAM62981.1 16S rRNA methyltransferase [Herbaspirillum rubrisubalbicans]RAN46753.1 16S rRNA methyltransferase [Herbaspirillum rubrisubalbicans]
MSNTADLNDLTRTLKEGATAMGLTLSAAQLDQLMAYQALLAKWNKVYNLTALRDPAQMVTHHLLDSLSAVSAFAGAQRVLDVGAGGGLPGIVLAIWAAQAQPQMKITLVDTVQKKTAFLNQVKAQLQLSNVTVLHARVEQLPVEQQYDVITSRAFAELKDFITWSNHLLQPGGKYIALKGVLPQEEIDRLPAGWQVQHVQPLQVPGLDAERHLIFMERAT